MISKDKFNELLYVNIDPSWVSFFNIEKKKSYYDLLINRLYVEYSNNEIYPKIEEVFRVFKESSYEELKVVIIGQDPYHTKGVADGLAFSSKNKLAPSLRNIYKEIANDLNIYNSNPDLTSWAKQGVMLLNTALSVKANMANSHKALGWDTFTENLILYLNSKEDLVYILWGNKAKEYKVFIKDKFIVEGFHPSPFTGKKFFYQSYFSKVNNYLKLHNIKEIDWSIKDV
jgi:uracil-DNA glycosylase